VQVADEVMGLKRCKLQCWKSNFSSEKTGVAEADQCHTCHAQAQTSMLSAMTVHVQRVLEPGGAVMASQPVSGHACRGCSADRNTCRRGENRDRTHCSSPSTPSRSCTHARSAGQRLPQDPHTHRAHDCSLQSSTAGGHAARAADGVHLPPRNEHENTKHAQDSNGVLH